MMGQIILEGESCTCETVCLHCLTQEGWRALGNTWTPKGLSDRMDKVGLRHTCMTPHFRNYHPGVPPP